MRRRGKNRQRAATHRKNSPIFGILTGIAGFFFLLTCSVVLVLNFRPLYYYDVQSLHLSEETGLSEETICRNYDVLIDYNLFWKGEDTLTFPDFPMSEQGRIHFREVETYFCGAAVRDDRHADFIHRWDHLECTPEVVWIFAGDGCHISCDPGAARSARSDELGTLFYRISQTDVFK